MANAKEQDSSDARYQRRVVDDELDELFTGLPAIGHLRTWNGDREIDLIIERGRKILAIEVKLGQVPDDRDVRHLLWLGKELGDDLADTVIVTTAQEAYRRPDRIAVISAARLGPWRRIALAYVKAEATKQSLRSRLELQRLSR